MLQRLVILLVVVLFTATLPTCLVQGEGRLEYLEPAQLLDCVNPFCPFRSKDPLLLFSDPEKALTFEGALAIAEQLDRIADRLEMPPVPNSREELVVLAIEIIPFYYYDRIVEGEKKLPPIIWHLMDGDNNFHVLGRCYPGERPSVQINIRFANPWSSWYGKDALFSTLVHELGHAQGIYKYNDADTEPATQLATLEVLAAMSRDNNVRALKSFVRELQGYAADFAFSRALQDDRLDEFRVHLDRTGSGIYTRAKFERSMDHWASDMERLEYILEHYGEVPFRLLVEALNDPAYRSAELLPLPNKDHRLTVNDSAWVLEHLYQMAREHHKLMEAYRDRAQQE